MSINRLTLILSAVALPLTVLFLFAQNDWQKYQSIEAGEYCEHTDYESLIRQPVNTISNIPFFLVGSWIILSWRKDRNEPTPETLLSKHPYFSLMLGVVTILAGLSSLLFHGGYVDWTKTLDSTFVLGVAGTIVLVLMRFAQQKRLLAATPLWYDVIIIFLGVAALTVFMLMDQDAIFPVIMLLLLGLGLFYKLSRDHKGFDSRALVLALTTLGLGFTFRQLDTHKIICEPHSVLQLHALWHILSAVSVWYFYKLLHSIK